MAESLMNLTFLSSFPPLLPGPLSKSLWANDSLKCPDQWWRHLLYINTISPWTPSEVQKEGGREGWKEGGKDVCLMNLLILMNQHLTPLLPPSLFLSATPSASATPGTWATI